MSAIAYPSAIADIQNLKANRILDVSGRFGSIAS